MGSNYDYSVLSSEGEAVRCSEIMAQSFVAHPEDELQYLRQVGFENVRVIRQGGEIVGGVALLPMGQWFGGQRVAMTGVASVAVAPHVRGQGAATCLMTALVRELAAGGTALSTLYPAVKGLYEKVGYGLGGSRYTWRIATDQIQVENSPWPWRPCSLAEVDPEWMALKQPMALVNPGHLDRHSLLWRRLLKSPGEGMSVAYWLGTDGPDLGYVLTYQERRPEGTTLTIRDWAASTLEGMQSLWALLYQQRAQIERVQWAGGAVDCLGLALPEPNLQMTQSAWWMTRIVDLHQALTQRGYPSHCLGELHLNLQDRIVPGNQGKVVLQVQGGKGQVTPGGRGDISLDIQHLSSLFTGVRSAQELYALGLLQAPREALSLADALFAGPTPWMPDFF